jgi:hypothetical protein
MVCGLAAAACGRRQRPLKEILPAEPGEWRREAFEDRPAAGAPDPLGRLGVRQAGRARYRGPAAITVDVYEMTTGSGAFEAAQKWKPALGTLAFHQNEFFVVLTSEAPRETLLAFAQQLEKALR